MATPTRSGVVLIDDAPFISTSLRESANACTADQPALTARLRLAADVIDALLHRLALAEFAARTNKGTIEEVVQS